MALLEALNSHAFYVGALGSRKNQQTRKARLKEHFDLTDDALDRLHGPVGLSIGAKTPAEIAVSILAEIIQVKNEAFIAAKNAGDLPQSSRLSACALG
jgi:xanthine dehydrogenase accessory factor